MSIHSDKMWPDLWEFAESGRGPDVQAHLSVCAECRRELAKAMQMVSALALRTDSAPAHLVTAAKRLMETPVRRFSLVRTSLSALGARNAGSDFQAVFNLDETEVRVLYSKTDTGWEVVSKVPSAEATPLKGGVVLALDIDGRFHFEAKELGDTGFILATKGARLEVPSGAEGPSGPGQTG